MSNNEYLATQKEAANFLKVSTKSIARYRKRGMPYKLILNPVTGKQEVRFRYADLERWDEGRHLLATYPRDAEETMDVDSSDDADRQARLVQHDGFLDDLLIAYKQQIEILRDQLEDMREQLARRDRQFDDLMRLMVGLQLEYKPTAPAVTAKAEASPEDAHSTNQHMEEETIDLYETVVLPDNNRSLPRPVTQVSEPERSMPDQARPQQPFTREQLAASIQQLRQKGKSFEAIARGLNQIKVPTLSGHLQWTPLEVQSLLPALLDSSFRFLEEKEAL